MLTLILYVGEFAYGIDCQHVIEIVPSLSLEKIHRAPDVIAGIIKFYGSPVPVIDFCRLMTGNPCPSCFHTRIAILNAFDKGDQTQSLGIMGEKMVEVADLEQSRNSAKSFSIGKVAYLGETVSAAGQTIQLIKVNELFQTLQGMI